MRKWKETKEGTMIERTCKFCHKLLINKYVCRKHEKTVHQEKGLVECKHCPKKYTNIEYRNLSVALLLGGLSALLVGILGLPNTKHY